MALVVVVAHRTAEVARAWAQQLSARGHLAQGVDPSALPARPTVLDALVIEAALPASALDALRGWAGPVPLWLAHEGALPDDAWLIEATRVTSEPLLLGPARVDLKRGVVHRAGALAHLTDTETLLLAWLASRPGTVVSRGELLQRVWGYAPTMRTRLVDVTVARLRAKLEATPAEPTLLVTVRGKGYRLDGAAPATPAEDPDLRGRDAARTELRAWVEGGEALVLVGPPGIGKTRLARDLCEHVPGAVWCGLADASERDALQLVAEALGLPPGATAVQVALAVRAGQRPLLVLDSMKQVRSEQELAIAIGAELETIGFALEADFAYQSSNAYNRYVVTLTQEYYTIVHDLPTSVDGMFAPSVTPNDLARFVQPGNPAAFVHSVTYGRMFHLLIQSTDSVQAMSASIDASFQAAVAGGSLSADASYVSELSDVSIGGWAEGGDAGLAAAALQGDFEALSAFLEDGGTITTGVPLSYVVRSVNRPDLTLNVASATEYTVKECVPVGASLDAPLFVYDADVGVHTEWSSLIWADSVTRWESVAHGDTDDFDGVPPHLRYAGYVVPDAVNGRGDAIIMQAWTESDGRVQLPGNGFRDTDYTVFAVVKNPHNPDLPDDEHYFMWSPSRGERQGLHLGFRGTDVLLSHGGEHELVAPVADDRLGTWYVYTFRYSAEEGASVYQNGVLLASDTTAEPLLSFNSASLGAANADRYPDGFLGMSMASVQAYAIAATEVQRRYIEDSLIERYGL